MGKQIKKTLGVVILVALVVLSAVNQWNYNLVYFFRYRQAVFDKLALNDYQRHYKSLPTIFEVVRHIEQLPEGSVLYFVPLFVDTPGVQSNTFWWWHLNHILRYFSYPKKILIMYFDLYHSERGEYIRKYMQGKQTFADLEWIKSRQVSHLILYRNNTISIVPVSTPVEL